MAITETTDLEAHGISPRGQVYWNPTVSQCYPRACPRRWLSRRGRVAGRRHGAAHRPVASRTATSSASPAPRTGSPGAMSTSRSRRRRSRASRERLADRLGSGDLYVVDAFAGADPGHRLAVRVVTESPWHALFARTLFIDPSERELADHRPQALVLHAPSVEAEPSEDGTRSETFILLHPTRGEVLIGGTLYAGEIKKSIFAVMNDRLRSRAFFRCTARQTSAGRAAWRRHGEDDSRPTPSGASSETTSTAGETRASSTSRRLLRQGDPSPRPSRRSTARPAREGRCSNVIVDERGILDLDDDSKTENTRAAYKLEQIENALPEKRAGHPSAVVFPDRRRVRDPPPSRAPDAGPGALLLPVRVHREARRDGGRGRGADADVLGLLRRAFLPQAPAVYAGMLGKESSTSTRRSRSGS